MAEASFDAAFVYPTAAEEACKHLVKLITSPEARRAHDPGRRDWIGREGLHYLLRQKIVAAIVNLGRQEVRNASPVRASEPWSTTYLGIKCDVKSFTHDDRDMN
ncbi:hypothetical protein [Bradyrhizobium zhanjiangense]|uniref:hypothetical protein n=1 Tax=Bradyrhizobium zhanjiangense TaxID=1325107 RepID=UPI0010090AFC|nr:hypothetical protein [Bradyrhizobium zhanjiangense]